jgi:hypothetical protein
MSQSKLGDEVIARIADQTSHGLAQDHVFRTKVIWGIIKIVIVTAVLSYLTLLGGGYYVVQKYTQSADQTVSNRIYSAMVGMTNKINVEFETARIKETVESVAEGEAKSILISNVQPVVAGFRAEIASKLDALTGEQEFLGLATRARANDFQAYLRLLAISQQTNSMGRDAARIIEDINRVLDAERSSSTYRTISESLGDRRYQGPFATDEIALKLDADYTSRTREGFVNVIRDLKQPLFIGKLVEWLTKEEDLLTADRITLAISEFAKEDFRPRDLDRVKSWWKSHQISYANWPKSSLELGWREFSAVHYPQAAEAFEQVLKFDSGADMSRAHAIACYWETAQTNRATAMANEFKNPSTRWAQWAAAMAELEGGDTNNATIRFASITTNFPSMSRLPLKGSHVFRHLDWPLFDRLVGTNAP